MGVSGVLSEGKPVVVESTESTSFWEGSTEVVVNSDMATVAVVDSTVSVVRFGDTDDVSAAWVVFDTSFGKLEVLFEFETGTDSSESLASSERSVLAMDINSVSKVSLVEVTVETVVVSTSNGRFEESFEPVLETVCESCVVVGTVVVVTGFVSSCVVVS